MSVGLEFPELVEPIKGVRLSAISAKIYDKERTDLALFEIAEGSQVSAVFTQNQFCAAPVQLAKQHLNKITPRYLLVNAGNANAGTGSQGLDDAANSCISLAKLVGCIEDEVLPFSTGVIGEDLPIDKINSALPELIQGLSHDGWLDTANAIMTTDTVPKAVSKSLPIGGSTVTISGIAKGAGMIRPDMATMLAFIATDANIEKALLDKVLSKSVSQSFNRITIDGDTSTNDACVLIATGKANNEMISKHNKECAMLEEALVEVFCELAQMIVRDGEGATKFLTIEVDGGKTEGECLSVAYKIAESPLVKTALTASDPNWGRILAAVGNADIDNLDISNVNVFIGDTCIVENGQRAPAYTEAEGKRVMLKDEIKLSVELQRGECKETIWTTDLSHEYIKINAEYRT